VVCISQLPVCDSSREFIAIMVNVFGDDSADESKKRVFAVAGVMATDLQWATLMQKWHERNGGTPFHATDCESDQRDYKGRDHAENQKLYKDLVILLADSGACGFGAALEISGYRLAYPELNEEMGYYKAFFEVVYRLSDLAKTFYRDGVKFTFDNRQQSNYSAAMLYDTMVNDAAMMADGPKLFEEISFVSSLKEPKIQVGDLFAREVMKELDNRVGPVKRPRRRSMETLVDTERFGCDLLMGKYFSDMRQKTALLEREDKEFNRHTYLAWINENKMPDTLGNRFKFLAFVKHIKN
jgi:hypothetical protein